MQKVALEEHFAIADTLMDSAGFLPNHVWTELSARLLDIHERRLSEMDKHGIEMTILSLNAPAVQGVCDAKAAIELARRANDYLAEQVAKRPDRFQAFGALPLQDPDAATTELRRCMVDLGFRGVLANGFSEVGSAAEPHYYDEQRYWSFWAEAEKLDAPFYLHPRNPPQSEWGIYRGHEWLLGPTWAFGQETAVHALRLMGSGLFDAYPGLKIILGHLGEGLPYSMWRVDNRNGWTGTPPQHRSKHSIGHYFRKHFWLTTAGNFRTQSLIDAILEIGADRIMFSTDWPFENIDHATQWFAMAAISENDLYKIGRLNAARLFKLGDLLGDE
jgi:gamma-resorcylate decarboxylase